MKTCAICLIPLFGAAALATAQSTISSTNRYAYAANAGWIDLRADTTNGVVVTETCLSGKAYAANFGWIDLGDGTPANGIQYANTSAADFGVNVSSSGALDGYAYSANTGWIRFEQTYGKPTVSFLTGMITGYAYSANLGWISLDTAFSDLVTDRMAVPDTDGDGIGDAYERLYAGNLTTLNAIGDWDRDGSSDRHEYIANTQPSNPADNLRIISQNHNAAHTSVSIEFSSRPNRLYTILHDTDLVGTWTDSGWSLFAPDAGSTTTRAFSYPTGSRRFFRVAAHLPLQP